MIQKISQYFKIGISIFLKIIIAILMGLGSSLGRKPIEIEHKDHKTIGSTKWSSYSL